MMKRKFTLLIAVFIVGLSHAQQLAFPGAEGYGKYTKGGRGGKVYEVTNLNDSGTGSLRAAVEASGARTVVFRVSGTIKLTRGMTISNPYITIAGQTAPGDGICLKDYPLEIKTDEVIIRYIRVRLGDASGTEADAISSRYRKNIIVDHVSASWSVDETMSIYNGETTTVQWCLVSESLYKSSHSKGTHGYGAIWGGNEYTSHHNLLAHHSSRNPRFSSGCGFTDYKNNVLYNWGYMSCYGAEEKDQGNPTAFSFAEINMQNNYYKPGPATSNMIFARPSTRDGLNDLGKWYLDGNYFYGKPNYTDNNWLAVKPDDGISYVNVMPDAPFEPMPIEMQTAEEAYRSVLDNVGATLPKRDTVDARIIHEVVTGTATYGGSYGSGKGIIDSPDDVGGYPELVSSIAPLDSDHDGMPDEWEEAHSLNKNDPADGNNVASNGYTMLEVYLNSIEFNYAVEKIQLSKNEDNHLKVSWRDAYISEAGFILEKSTDGTNYVFLDSLSENRNTYIDTDQIIDPNLRYRVVAYRDSFSTPVSNDYVVNNGIEILPQPELYVGDTIQLEVVLTPENSSNKVVEWGIHEDDVLKASINQLGELITSDTGIVQVSARTTDGSDLIAQVEFHVLKDPNVNDIGVVTKDEINFTCFPNPTYGSLTFQFYCPEVSLVSLDIVDMNGTKMSNIFKKQLNMGDHNIPWNGKNRSGEDLSPGFYFCVITLDHVKYVHRFVRL